MNSPAQKPSARSSSRAKLLQTEKQATTPRSRKKNIPLVTDYWRPEHFLNRELSWLEFNARVLEEAFDEHTPLLERVKFLSIFSTNLDEFFMIRVAGVKRQIDAKISTPVTADGMSPPELLAALSTRIHQLVQSQHRLFLDSIEPKLAQEGVLILKPEQLSASQKDHLHTFFYREILPILTPMAVDPGHPFPYLSNGTLCLIAEIRNVQPTLFPHTNLSIIHLPIPNIPRFLSVPCESNQQVFIMLENVVRMHLDQLFNGYEVINCATIRVTRDSDIEYEEEGADDLLTAIEKGLRNRRHGASVRLQYDPKVSLGILDRLVKELELEPEDLYPTEGFTGFADLMQLYGAIDIPRLKDPAYPPQLVPCFENQTSMWDAIRERDILVYHPYQSFDTVVRFVQDAAEDPNVLAIKMTLYRVSGNSPITEALTRAAERGKAVSVLVELKARFDEEANIHWARQLEHAGAHVIYGIVGFKTHCKVCLVVRREKNILRRYCHLGTGNYNDRTAKVYSDIGLFTCREDIGEDVTQLFNLLTGYALPTAFHHLILSPPSMREAMVQRLHRESDQARKGRPAMVIAKMNSLVDPDLIVELYRASQAGVQIRLIIRGICSLKPGMPGLSDNIQVISIIGRFLEHVRLFYFHNNGQAEYLLSSADWMQRNLDGRIEIAFPVLDVPLQNQLWEYLQLQLSDTVKSRVLKPDGTSYRAPVKDTPVHSQDRLYAIACDLAQTEIASEAETHPAYRFLKK